MGIGIIGAGAIGSAFARALGRAGIAAIIGNSRGPGSLADLVREAGPTIEAGTREQAAAADLVLAADPRAEGGRRVLFYAGDEGEAKAEVAALIDRLGFFGIDLGSLAGGGRLVQFPGGPLPGHNLVRLG